ncbi:HTH myb-type domain-containing protein [Lachancea thermotolerans]
MTTSKSAVSLAGAGGGLVAQSKNPSSWDPQDDVLLRHLKEIKKLGWKDIAQYFKNRTPNACQFRWRRLKSGNLKTAGRPGEVPAVADAVGVAPAAGTQPAAATPQAGAAAAAAVPHDLGQPVHPALLAATAAPASEAYPPRALSQPALGPLPNAGTLSAVPAPSPAPHQPAVAAFPLRPTLTGATLANAQSRHSLQPAPGAGKFAKPRSYSHTMAPPSGFAMASASAPFSAAASAVTSNSTGHVPTIDVNESQDENLGLIPKVLVRSRRSSVAQQSLLPSSSTPNLSLALHTTLTTSKLRKNSFSSRPRRSSFNMAPPDRVFSTPSRRSSVVQAPSSIASISRRESFNSSNSRRGSAIQTRRESFAHSTLDRRESVSNYTDIPKAPLQNFAPANASSLHQATYPTEMKDWSLDEDKLLSGRQENHLSMDELSILLPHRSEQEIQWRIGALDKSTYSSSSDSPLDSPERSLTEDIAVDEEGGEAVNDASRNPSQTPFNIKKEVSPSLSASSGSNDREHSPVFSPRPVNRDQSPTTFDSSFRPNIVVNKSVGGSSYNCSPGLDGHRNPSFPPAAEPMAPGSHGAQLPSLNSIFKNIL